MLGTICFIGPGALQGAIGGFGDFLELVSAALFAIQLWRCEKIIRNVPENRIAEITCLQLSFVAFFSLIVYLSQGHSIPALVSTVSAFPPMEWAQVAMMGFITTAFCLWAEARALRDVDAAPAVLIYACEPVWGAVFAYLWRGEMPDGPVALVGGGLLLLASLAGAAASASTSKAQVA